MTCRMDMEGDNWWVVYDLLDEMTRQDAKFGADLDFPDYIDIYCPDLRCELYGLPPEVLARRASERAFAAGDGCWADILIEEVCEAISSPNTEHLRLELVQCAAVIVQWIKAIDRRAS